MGQFFSIVMKLEGKFLLSFPLRLSGKQVARKQSGTLCKSVACSCQNWQAVKIRDDKKFKIIYRKILQETLLRIIIRANHAGGVTSEKAQGEGKRVKWIIFIFLTPSKDFNRHLMHSFFFFNTTDTFI